MAERSTSETAAIIALRRWQHALRRRLLPFLGPLSTLIILVGADLFARRGTVSDTPGTGFLAAIILSAYLGGVRAGLGSAALTMGYALVPAAAASPHAVSPDTAGQRLVILVLLAVGAAVLVGRLKERADRRLAGLREAVVERDEANRRLEYLALTDALTGIPNRRCFDALLAAEWSAAARTNSPLALLLIDVDEFKAYNDQFGHPAGDAALQRIARALSDAVQRPRDRVTRYSGEEFAVLLPETDEAGAVAVAEQLRLVVSALQLNGDTGREDRSLTVSVGAAVLVPVLHSDPAALVEAADAALYQAKRAGRNRVYPTVPHGVSSSRA